MNNYRFDTDRHIHLLNEKPLFGTSTIVGEVISKNLTWWSAEHAAITALESGEHIPTIRSEYEEACNSENKKKAIDKLQKKYPIFKKARFAHYEEKNKKADNGKDLHVDLESWIKYQMGLVSVPSMNDKIKPFIEWSNSNVKRWLASEFNVYSSVLWCGGIVDALAQLNDGSIVLIDFKSAKEAYLSHYLQTAGYTIQLLENGLYDANGKKLEVSISGIDRIIIFPFGANSLEPKYNELPLNDLMDGFKSCVSLYKLIKRGEN